MIICRRIAAKQKVRAESSSGLEKDDRALQDIAMYETLTAMGLETDDSNVIQPPSMTTESVMAVLQGYTDTEYCPETIQRLNEDSDVSLAEDTIVDAFRINNCVDDDNMVIRWSYVWSQLQELIDGHCRGIECAFRDIAWL
jgi:hypothetical protein